MELVLVTNTARNAVVELTESGKYYSEKEYDIYVNGEHFAHTDKQVTSLYGFKPDTDYEVTAVYDGKEYGPVCFHTDYEFVTLNVKDFGAYGDGEHDDTVCYYGIKEKYKSTCSRGNLQNIKHILKG
jgi:polygalacturonase